MVALLAEGVDRNSCLQVESSKPAVALLAEGVDRNIDEITESNQTAVALLAEGVDRNLCIIHNVKMPQGRPPRGGRG